MIYHPMEPDRVKIAYMIVFHAELESCLMVVLGMVEDKASYYKGKANVRITNQSCWNMSTDNQIHPKNHRATKRPYEVR